jgi:hypothetical protein
VEWLFRRLQLGPGAVAAYVLAGGLGAAGLAGFLAWTLGYRRAIHGAWIAAMAVLALPVLYHVNVGLLPGEPFASPFSLLADLLVLAAFAAPPLLWGHFRGLGLGGRGASVAGSVALVGAAWAFVASIPAPSPVPRGTAPGPDLLLVVIDSARRASFGLFGYGRSTSRPLDDLGRTGRVYSRAYSGSSWTVPSVQLMLQPPQLPEPLVKALVRAGYATAAFTDNPHLGRGSSLMSGFHRVDRSVRPWRAVLGSTILGLVVERLAPGDDRGLVEKAGQWLGAVHGAAFLYAHLMDAHAPFERRAIDGKPRTGRRIVFPVTGMRLSADEADDIVARYDAGLRDATAEAASLVEMMRQRGRPFLAIITADHGESLGESGRWFHGRSLAPELLDVPMIVVGTDVAPGWIDASVGQASVSRTLLDVAAIACAGCPGSDLRTSAGDRPIDGWLPPSQAYRVADGYKLVIDFKTGSRKLFEVDSGIAGTRDVTADHIEEVERLSVGLSLPVAKAATPASEDIERIRALGYVGR